ALLSALAQDGGPARNQAWLKEAETLRAERQARLAAEEQLVARPMKPQRVYAELRRVLPSETIVALDAGAAPAYGYDRLSFARPLHRLRHRQSPLRSARPPLRRRRLLRRAPRSGRRHRQESAGRERRGGHRDPDRSRRVPHPGRRHPPPRVDSPRSRRQWSADSERRSGPPSSRARREALRIGRAGDETLAGPRTPAPGPVRLTRDEATRLEA